ncbi:GNAT family protein [Sulfuricurvum sp.]|uniref:GNAT family N-acetyltransferase n=1 Tax=Sulfuricurvum sp. TaxID=2025608 RepID=UPI0019B4DDE7|nr:GNAT family protein [Sulfuricurvum sp.]MBD3806057.1 GNAT family N-acetyltransferase [Sulfuricurvum sp.]
MRLEGKNIYLRPIEISDAEGAYPTWLNDPDVCRYNSHGDTTYTRKMAQAYIANVTDNPTYAVFAICLREDGRHVGNISLQHISAKNSSAEFAILIGDPSVYGNGIGFEASHLLFDYGFNSLHLHRIYCGTHYKNKRMRSLAEKLGMNQEGYRKEALFKNGEFVDIVEYGILNRDYQKAQL